MLVAALIAYGLIGALCFAAELRAVRRGDPLPSKMPPGWKGNMVALRVIMACPWMFAAQAVERVSGVEVRLNRDMGR